MKAVVEVLSVYLPVWWILLIVLFCSIACASTITRPKILTAEFLGWTYLWSRVVILAMFVFPSLVLVIYYENGDPNGYKFFVSLLITVVVFCFTYCIALVRTRNRNGRAIYKVIPFELHSKKSQRRVFHHASSEEKLAIEKCLAVIKEDILIPEVMKLASKTTDTTSFIQKAFSVRHIYCVSYSGQPEGESTFNCSLKYQAAENSKVMLYLCQLDVYRAGNKVLVKNIKFVKYVKVNT